MADEPDNSNKPTEKLVSDDENPTKYTNPDPDNSNISSSPNNKNNNSKDIEIQLSPSPNNQDSILTEDKPEEEKKKDEFYTAKAHLARRIYHVIIFLTFPIIYLWLIDIIADGIGIDVPKILSFFILLAMILEFIRLKKRWIMFGQREYERDHICAQAWGTIGTLIVLLLAFPRTYSIAPVIITDANGKERGSEAFACFGQIAIPIIWSLGIGDPLLGELKGRVRSKKLKPWQMYLIANCVLIVIWLLCFLWCGTSWWLAIIIPPIAIIAEKPSIPHIDDNGLMLLVPLLFTLIFEPWFKKECDQIFYN